MQHSQTKNKGKDAVRPDFVFIYEFSHSCLVSQLFFSLCSPYIHDTHFQGIVEIA